MDEKSKSIKRGKTSLALLTDIGTKEITNIIIPGSGFAYELCKRLYLHGLEFFGDRRDSRIQYFYKSLLGNSNPEEQEKLINKSFSTQDYYSLLSSAIQDEEDEKVEIYALIFRAILSGTLKNSYKIHIIKSFKELSCDDIELMRAIYISSKYEFKNGSSISEQISKLTSTNDPLKNISIQSLVRHGFLLRKDNGEMVPTQLLEISITIIYLENQLTPNSIGKRAWSKITAAVISELDQTPPDPILKKISDILYSSDIKHSIVAPVDDHHKRVFLPFDIIILCLRKNDDMDLIKRFMSKIKNNVLVKLLIDDELVEGVSDPLPEVGSDELFNFAANNEEEIKRFRSYLSEQHFINVG